MSTPSTEGFQAVKLLCSERIERAISVLKDRWLSPFDLVLEVLDESNAEYSGYCTSLYKENNTKLSRILDHIAVTDSGERKLRSFMGPRTLDIVCKTIEDEMDTIAKGESLPGLSTISPNFIKSWMIAYVLRRAAQTSLAKE
ncbi:hypothetical protein EI94DRAFT_1700716 [Lactarius quietus]|nr:hypothetical protein EI94DRAFT_1700716 [Lactarius quietus]